MSPRWKNPSFPRQPPKDVSDQAYIWVAANIGDPFYTDELKAWAAAVKDLGVKPTTITGPVNQDVPAQIAVVEQAIANPTTAGILMGAAIDYKSTDTVLAKARAAGIPTLYGNGQGEDSAARDAFVGTDNFALGRKSAELAVKALKGKGKVGITAITAAANIQQRITGFTKYLKANAPDIHVDAVVNEDGSAKSQTDAANNLLQAHPDLNLVYNTDDSGSLFIAQVLKEQGLKGKVQIIGTNAAADQLPTLKNGEVYANVTQDLYAEEWISLHFLFWLHNKMTTVPDTCYGVGCRRQQGHAQQVRRCPIIAASTPSSLRAQRSNPGATARGLLDCFVARAPRNDGWRNRAARVLAIFRRRDRAPRSRWGAPVPTTMGGDRMKVTIGTAPEFVGRLVS